MAEKKPPTLGSSSTLGYPSDGGPRRIGDANTYHEAYTAQYRAACRKCGARRIDSQIGLERTPDEYVAKLVAVFREVRRVLRKDGTVWLNLGDCYTSGGRASYGGFSPDSKQATHTAIKSASRAPNPPGLKPKDLVGIPWRVAFALQADGWWLRSDIVWDKPNPMPESVRDRPTRAHEYVFLLTKSARYFWDQDAIRQPLTEGSMARLSQPTFDQQTGGPKDYGEDSNRSARKTLENMRHNLARKTSQVSANRVWTDPEAMKRIAEQGANARTVWRIATEPFAEAHFATFPTELPRRCILAGSKLGDLVLDPFSGAGTVALVADMLGRDAVGLELNPEYIAIAERRIRAPRSDAEAERRGREDAGQEVLFSD